MQSTLSAQYFKSSGLASSDADLFSVSSLVYFFLGTLVDDRPAYELAGAI